jgi:hypothetical protein
VGDLTKDFNRKEFACKCGCGRDNVSLELVNQLQRLRNEYGKPIVINRGCSCIQHNKDVGGVPDSAHICERKEGEAVDIHIENTYEAFKLIQLSFKWQLFWRIGVGNTLLHLDVSQTLPTPRLWVYKDK